MKRGKVKINLSNRAIYSLIALGILTILATGVYAYGTSAPATFGHSYGEIQPCSNGQTMVTAGGVWACTIAGDADWTFSGNNMYSGVSGNIGIGTQTPSQKLEVSGGVLASSFLYSSDRELKTNIQPLTNSLELVKQLEGVSFNWKSNGKQDIGLIAQDVEKVFPELVSTDNNGLKSVEYANLVAVLIEAIKEQQKQIDELRESCE